MIQLGLRPEPLRVILVNGSTFRTQFTLEDPLESFDDIAPILRFEDGTEWEASLSEDDTVASWDKTVLQVETLVASLGLGRQVTLLYNETFWAQGRVEIH